MAGGKLIEAGGKHSKAQKYTKSLKRTDSSSRSGPRPYNNYNLYFILERELFLQERGVYPSMNHPAAVSTLQRSTSTGSSRVDYSGIDIPPLPSRYSALVLPDEWYVHKKRKRAHVKSHGLVSFTGMASMVAARWKQEGDDIRLFLKTVSDQLKERYDELKKLSPSTPAVQKKKPTMVPLSPITVPSNEERLRMMTTFLQDVPPANRQHCSPNGVPSNDWILPSPIDFPSNQEKYHSMTNFLQDVPLAAAQPGICLCVSEEQMRRSSSVTSEEVDISDDDIIAMWSGGDTQER